MDRIQGADEKENFNLSGGKQCRQVYGSHTCVGFWAPQKAVFLRMGDRPKFNFLGGNFDDLKTTVQLSGVDPCAVYVEQAK